MGMLEDDLTDFPPKYSIVKQLRAVPSAPLKTPQCSATPQPLPPFANGYRRDRAAKLERKGFDPERCSHSSSYTIDGRPFCTRHAGMAALEILMSEDRADEVDA